MDLVSESDARYLQSEARALNRQKEIEEDVKETQEIAKDTLNTLNGIIEKHTNSKSHSPSQENDPEAPPSHGGKSPATVAAERSRKAEAFRDAMRPQRPVGSRTQSPKKELKQK